jgi:transcriptional regulator with XRE-family HTH domain
MVHERERFANLKTDHPRIGENGVALVMELKDKLQMLMARHALNGQKLARSSQVSDSEISRILQGKSRPGLDNAFRLARSVGVTLDYLADDSLDAEPPRPEDHLSAEERRVLALAQKIGSAHVISILENVRFLGYEVAMSRLVGGKPIIEVDKELAETRSGISPSGQSLLTSRVNSVTV